MENGKALAVRDEGGGLAPRSFSRDQVDLLKRTVAAGATDDELKLFLNQAQRMGLDPFAKQIHFVKRQDKGTIQVAIDGYRLIADRTGKYAGNDDPIFEGDEDGHPLLARVTVWKLVGGVRCSFTATARWAEYVPQGNQGFMWRRMPHVMLGKVAEALALRKAFPAELSGAYVDAEMDQADVEAAAQPQRQTQARRPAPRPPEPAQQPSAIARAFDPAHPPSSGVATDAQVKAIYAIGREKLGMSEDDVEEAAVNAYGSIPKLMTKAEASAMIKALQSGQTPPSRKPDVVEGEVVQEQAEF